MATILMFIKPCLSKHLIKYYLYYYFVCSTTIRHLNTYSTLNYFLSPAIIKRKNPINAFSFINLRAFCFVISILRFVARLLKSTCWQHLMMVVTTLDLWDCISYNWLCLFNYIDLNCMMEVTLIQYRNSKQYWIF